MVDCSSRARGPRCGAADVLLTGMIQRALLVGSFLVSSFGACSSGHSGSTTPPGNTAPPKAPDYAASVADPLGFLPVDSEIVMGLDVDSVRTSALWPHLSSRITATAGPQLAMFQQMCGFDPMATVHRIRLGLKNLKAEKPEGVIVITGLDRPQLMACMAKAGNGAAVIEGDYVTFDAAKTGGTQAAFAFVDASTAVVTLGASANKDQLKAVLASGMPLRKSPAFMQLLTQTDVEASLWGMMNANSSIFDQLAAGIGTKPKAMFGSVRLNPGMTINMHVRLDTADAAQKLATMANNQVGMAKGFVTKLDITTEAADVVVAVGMDDQQLNSLIMLVAGQLGSP